MIAGILGGCRIVEIADYVHPPTHELRQAIVWRSDDGLKLLEGQDLVVVPNFREFTDSFSGRRAQLILVSRGETAVEIGSVTLKNLDSGHTETRTLQELSHLSTSVPGTGYYSGRVLLYDENHDDLAGFDNASGLELSVTYRGSGRPTETKTFELRLEHYKDWAWPT